MFLSDRIAFAEAATLADTKVLVPLAEQISALADNFDAFLLDAADQAEKNTRDANRKIVTALRRVRDIASPVSSFDIVRDMQQVRARLSTASAPFPAVLSRAAYVQMTVTAFAEAVDRVVRESDPASALAAVRHAARMMEVREIALHELQSLRLDFVTAEETTMPDDNHESIRLVRFGISSLEEVRSWLQVLEWLVAVAYMDAGIPDAPSPRIQRMESGSLEVWLKLAKLVATSLKKLLGSTGRIGLLHATNVGKVHLLAEVDKILEAAGAASPEVKESLRQAGESTARQLLRAVKRGELEVDGEDSRPSLQGLMGAEDDDEPKLLEHEKKQLPPPEA